MPYKWRFIGENHLPITNHRFSVATLDYRRVQGKYANSFKAPNNNSNSLDIINWQSKLMINLSSIKSTWRFFWPTYRMSLDQRSDLSLGPLSFSKVVGPAFSTIGSYGGPAEPVVGWPFGLFRLRFPMVFPASRTGLAFSSGSCHGHTTGSGWTLMGRDSCRIHTWRWSTHRENGGLKPTGMECKLHGIELAIWCLVSGSATHRWQSDITPTYPTESTGVTWPTNTIPSVNQV